MIITLDELYKGKSTRIKNKEYFSTEAYVEPFLERMSKFTDDFRVQVKLPDQISLTKDGDVNLEDVVYNRVLIQAVLPEEYCLDNHKETIGLVYGLDTRKPIAKIYRGILDMVCTNLCIFNPSFLNIQEIEPETPINFSCVNPLMEQATNIKNWMEMLVNTEIKYDNQLINENLGKWVRNAINLTYSNGYGKVKLASSSIIDAYKLIYEDDESRYYVEPGHDTTLYNIYGGLTQTITDNTRDFFNSVEKTLLVKDILGVNI